MRETQYVLIGEGQILPKAPEWSGTKKYANEASFSSALERFLEEYEPTALDLSKVSTGPVLYADMQLKYFLTIEEGLALVTGLSFDIAAEAHTFEWGGQTFFPIRPDLNFLVITQAIVQPVNVVEHAVLNCMTAFYPFYQTLNLSIEAGELDPDRKYPFERWLDYWLRRGIDVKGDCFRAHNQSDTEVKPSYALAIAALTELLKAPVQHPRPNGLNQAAIKTAILERFKWRGLKERNLDKIFAEANRAAKEAE